MIDELMKTFKTAAFIIGAIWIVTAGLGLTGEPQKRKSNKALKRVVYRQGARGGKWNTFDSGAVDDDMDVLYPPNAYGNPSTYANS